MWLRRNKALLALFAAAGLVVSEAALSQGASPPLVGSVAKFSVAEAKRPAPATPFFDPDGKRVTLSDLRGKLLVVNFWATWCVPCVHELPALERLATILGPDKAQVVLVSADRGDAEAVHAFLLRIGLPRARSYRDPTLALFRAFEGRALPTTILIGPDGTELGRLEGAAEWDQGEALALVRHYLK